VSGFANLVLLDKLIDMKLPQFLIIMISLIPSFSSANDGEAYARTAPGQIEIKQLPAARLMLSKSEQPYFSANNKLFGKLFNYIRLHEIPMTTPVEAKINPGVMIFYMDSASAVRTDLKAGAEVELINLDIRNVAAIGIRGSYSKENYEEGLARLQEWLKSQSQLEVIGEPYAVYWNSPFVPFFLKQSEVHIPVKVKK
jgi:effector-binding domain-containing protein